MAFKTGIKYLIFSLFSLLSALCFAQEEEKEIPEFVKEAQQYVFTGNEQLMAGSVLEGEKSYRQAISKNPNNLEAKYNLGYSYYKTSNFQESAMRSKEAVEQAKTKPEKHAAYHNLGNAYLQMQKPEEAIEAYKNALRNNPKDDETRYNLAVARQMKQQQDQNKDQNKDQNEDNKEGDDKEENEDKKESEDGEKDKEDKKDDEGKEDEKDKDEKEDEKDKKDEEGEGDEEKEDEKKQPQPREGKLSPEQVKSLLEAMADEEKKVQDKMNDKKQGVRVKTDKDW